MPWDPGVYNQFKAIRYKPFFDLVDLITAKDMKSCVDIGCGTGEQTAILAERFKPANFTGFDASKEMLAESKKMEHENLHFELSTIEDFSNSVSNWDLVFSNAALQWSDDHPVLVPKLIAKLNPGGQFAVQMPFQKENVLNKLLLELVQGKPFVDMLDGFARHSPLLEMDDYASILFKSGLHDLDISLRVYPIIAQNAQELYNFIAGSALIPYMERLDTGGQQLLEAAFIKRIEAYFVSFPAIYSFKRILLYGVKL
ncbi:MAG: methyltransferase domain-containing protein [Ferruginibacter sp.]